MVPFTKTDSSLVVVIKGAPRVVLREDPRFALILTELRGAANEDAVAEILATEPVATDTRTGFVESSLEIIPGASFYDNKLMVDGMPDDEFVNNMARRIYAEGFSLIPLARCLQRLALNPSFKIRRDLLSFLDVGKLPLREDGRFVAYKRVRGDCRDIHSGKFDNSVGQVLIMDRQKVDDDPNNTCSYGFHVCSHAYLEHFGSNRHGQDRAMACAVAPEDVVSIPADYNNTKMRTCQYEVIAELDASQWVSSAGLSDMAMYFDGDADATFGVFTRDESDEGSDWEFYSGHGSLAEANTEIAELYETEYSRADTSMQIRNLMDDTVLVQVQAIGSDLDMVPSAEYRVEAVKDGVVVAWSLEADEVFAISAASAMRAARPYVAIVRVTNSAGETVATR
jgi:hypothetical protein